MHDDDRDRIDMPQDDAVDVDQESRGYPAMPPLDAADADLEQEGERADPPDSGWAGAAQAAQGERDSGEEGGSS